MFPQRHSCDRCRQQKVRCLKIGDSQAGLGGDQIATCERCAKAGVPCVYSSKQRNRRPSQHQSREATTSPLRNVRFTQDLTDMLSGTNGSGTALNDMIPFFDMGEMAVSGLSDSDQFDWNNDASLSSILSVANEDCDIGTQETLGMSGRSRNGSTDMVDALTRQAMALSTRATRVTRQIAQAGSVTPLTVNSPVVNEVSEAANTLGRIIEGIMMGNSSASSTYPPHDENEPQPAADYGLVFLVLAAHQHVLALFKAICGSIQRSLGLMAGSDRQLPALHGDGASSAQFVMILQLIMHLTNRLGRSLQIQSGNAVNRSPDGQPTGIALFLPNELTPEFDGGEECGDSTGIVDLAQDMLGKLPGEHVKLRQIIQELQIRMEERPYTC